MLLLADLVSYGTINLLLRGLGVIAPSTSRQQQQVWPVPFGVFICRHDLVRATVAVSYVQTLRRFEDPDAQLLAYFTGGNAVLSAVAYPQSTLRLTRSCRREQSSPSTPDRSVPVIGNLYTRETADNAIRRTIHVQYDPLAAETSVVLVRSRFKTVQEDINLSYTSLRLQHLWRALWSDQVTLKPQSAYNFLVCGPKFTIFFSSHVGGSAGDNALFSTWQYLIIHYWCLRLTVMSLIVLIWQCLYLLMMHAQILYIYEEISNVYSPKTDNNALYERQMDITHFHKWMTWHRN